MARISSVAALSPCCQTSLAQTAGLRLASRSASAAWHPVVIVCRRVDEDCCSMTLAVAVPVR